MQKPIYIRIFSLTASILLILTVVLNICNILHPEVFAPYLIENWSTWDAAFFANGSRIAVPIVIASVLTFLPTAGYGIFHACRKQLSSRSFWIFLILLALGSIAKWLCEEDFCWYRCTDTFLQFAVHQKLTDVLMLVNAAAGVMLLYGSFRERSLQKNTSSNK